MKHPVRVFTDGGSRGNPGPAGFGVHAEDYRGRPLADLYGYLGRATNNVAEYAALIVALDWAVARSLTAVCLFSDSELLVKQMTGRYRVRNPGLRPLFERSRSLARRIPGLEIRHVRREGNRPADALANRAMDEQSGNVPSPL
ncbi:MAG: ribonuclease HI family protein [Acidobacteriota bacterium]